MIVVAYGSNDCVQVITRVCAPMNVKIPAFDKVMIDCFDFASLGIVLVGLMEIRL